VSSRDTSVEEASLTSTAAEEDALLLGTLGDEGELGDETQG
jgi:hypothetical protein